MRRSALVGALGPALAALLVLPGACGNAEPDSKSADGGSIDTVSVSGAPDKKPTLKFEKPYKAKQTESKVLKKGTGKTLAEGQQVVVDYVGLNGRNGKEFDSSWKRGESEVFSLQKGGLIKGFLEGLKGKKVGSRVLLSIAPKDGYGPQGGQPKAGIKKNDTLLFVVDVKKAYKTLTTAEGKPVEAPSDLPKVKTDDKGQVTGVEKPSGDPPEELVAQTLIKGTKDPKQPDSPRGSKVTKSSTVQVHLLGANWRTGKTFDSSWKRGAPLALPLAQVPVKGLAEGLVGQTVGSRVLLVLPPDQGFGKALPNTDVKKDDTVVLVVDILDSH